MATPRDWIKRSLRIINVLGASETPQADELVDGLSALNAMLGSWSNDELLIPSEQREEFDLVGGQASYTFGTSGDFNSSRPLSIERAGILIGDVETPVEILNQDNWALITSKTTQGTPSKIYLTGSYPQETVKVWPVPDVTAKLVIYSKKPLGSFANSSVTITLPEGYEEAVVYNLARRLQDEYGKQMSPNAMQIADNGLAAIRATNLKPTYMTSDAPGSACGQPNIFAGK